jgi:hypothetical protein
MKYSWPGLLRYPSREYATNNYIIKKICAPFMIFIADILTMIFATKYLFWEL